MNKPLLFRVVVIFSFVSLIVFSLVLWQGNRSTFTVAPKASKASVAVIKPAVASMNLPSSRALQLTSNPSSAADTAQTWTAPTTTLGKRLSADSVNLAKSEGKKAKGRSGVLESIVNPATLSRGDVVTIPLFDGEKVEGRVNLVLPEAGGIVRVGGKLQNGDAGTFSLTQSPSGVSGRILLTDRKLAFLLVPGENSETWLVETPLSDVLCIPYPHSSSDKSASSTTSGLTASPATTSSISVPVLSSRPTAPAVIYIDFDGATVTDPDWDGGNTIVAPSFNLTEAQIKEVWQRVMEDYLPFNIDVTTNLNRYNSVAPGKRMRCIVTPNDVAGAGAGGIAYNNSFAQSGSLFSATIPCWVFNDTSNTIAAAVSHEFGHTLGLSHDGRNSPVEEYFDGHGTGDVSWGPIMGSGYDSNLTQWSRGQYAAANNQEDDLAIISGSLNSFGYRRDDAGNTKESAAILRRNGGTVFGSGLIERTGDADFLVFNTGACTVNLTARRASLGPNLDIRLDLINAFGTTIAASNPDRETNATLIKAVPTGVYYVRVIGVGRGDLGDGYSNYGSIGSYSLSGSIPGAPQPPFIVSPAAVSGGVGKAFSTRIIATDTPSSYSLLGTLPSGLSFNASTGTISGTPTAPGNYSITLRATNASGTGTKGCVISVAGSPAPVISSAGTASGTVGSAFSYKISATNSPTSYRIEGILPTGLQFNTSTGLINGTPTAVMTRTVTIGATNSGGTGSKSLVITITASTSNLATAVDSPSRVWTTGGNALWKVITAETFDGADAAQSGTILDTQQTWIRTSVTGPVTMSFRWKVSSEASYDMLRFIVDGTVRATISGTVPWQFRTFPVPVGNHTVEWNYQKDTSDSVGSDAAYLDTVTIPAP